MKFGRLLLITLFTLTAGGLNRLAHADPIFPAEPICGDGAINTKDETCDDGNFVDGDGCDHLCHFEPIFPIEPICGDGKINTKDETCDDGNLLDGDGCDHLCKLELKAADIVPEAPHGDAAESGDSEAVAPPVDGQAAPANTETGDLSGMGGWGCSMAATPLPSSPLAACMAFLVLLAGMPSLLRKRK